MLAGTAMTGAVVSLTVTVKLALAVLLCVSCAEHVTVVVPIANVAPDAGEHVVGTLPSIASVAELVYVTTDPVAAVAATGCSRAR